MSKKGFDLFRLINESMKIAAEINKVTEQHRPGGKKGKRPPEMDDFALGIVKNLTAAGIMSSSFKIDPEVKRRKDEARAERRRESVARTEFYNIQRVLESELHRAMRPYRDEFSRVKKELEAFVQQLERSRPLLLREPEQLPLLHPARAEIAFDDFTAEINRLAEDYGKLYGDLLPMITLHADDPARSPDPAMRQEWVEKGKVAVAKMLDDNAYAPSALRTKLRETRDVLAQFWQEIETRGLAGAIADFDPSRTLASQFRKDMELGREDLRTLGQALNAPLPEQQRQYTSLSVAKIQEIVKDWQANGMSEDGADYIIHCYENAVIRKALDEMGFGKANAIPPKAKTNGGNSIASAAIDPNLGIHPDNHVTSLLELTRVDQIDHMLDILTLSAEIGQVSPSVQLARMAAKIAPPPIRHADNGQIDSARRNRYIQLISRLETCGIAKIGKSVNWQERNAFGPEHLRLLTVLRQAAEIDTPSPALAAAQAHMQDRQAMRSHMLALISPFWRSFAIDLLDRPIVKSESARDADIRAAMAPLLTFDASERADMRAEIRGLLTQFKDVDFGMASALDDNGPLDMQEVTSKGYDYRHRMEEALNLLELTEAQRAEFFAPPPEMPELGAFAEFMAMAKPYSGFYNQGPFADAMRARDFDAAERMIARWFRAAPPSPLRTAFLCFDNSKLSIESFGFENWLARSEDIAAFCVDFSSHCLEYMGDDNQIVSMEVSSYARKAFPEGEFSVSLLEQHSGITTPWQGDFIDIDTGSEISGIMSLYNEYYRAKAKKRGDWSAEYKAYHQSLIQLAEATIFLKVNQVVARELAKRTFSRTLPIIVGTHDFGSFNPVVHLARAEADIDAAGPTTTDMEANMPDQPATPTTDMPDLGEFAEFIAQSEKLSVLEEHGRYGKALKARNFIAAEQMINEWFRQSPPNAMRELFLSLGRNQLSIATGTLSRV